MPQGATNDGADLLIHFAVADFQLLGGAMLENTARRGIVSLLSRPGHAFIRVKEKKFPALRAVESRERPPESRHFRQDHHQRTAAFPHARLYDMSRDQRDIPFDQPLIPERPD